MIIPHATRAPLPDIDLWRKMKHNKIPYSFDLELTARCNNNCRHCYINLRAGDEAAAEKELTLEEISRFGDEAARLGVLWCLINGGEPLLRPDFTEVYLSLKKKGFLVSVFTNATLIKREHINLFKSYPPNLLEVTVYGVTRATYERITRAPGSFRAFMGGMERLDDGGIPVRLKAMALRSNVHELPAIREFCRTRTKDFFRFDPLLHLRYDRNPARNEEIIAERLSPAEIAELEKDDPERSEALQKGCGVLINPRLSETKSRKLFFCEAGLGNICLGHDGRIRLCSSLWHPDCLYDWRKGNLAEALGTFVPEVRRMTSRKGRFQGKCRTCPIINLCLWCPAHSYLETGELDQPVDSFCEVAQARAANLERARGRGERA